MISCVSLGSISSRLRKSQSYSSHNKLKLTWWERRKRASAFMVNETGLFPANFGFMKLIIDSACILSTCKLHGADNVTTFYSKFITGLFYLFTRSNSIIWKKTVRQQLLGEWSTRFSARQGRRGKLRALQVRFLLTWKIRKNSACWRLAANFSSWKSFVR